LFLNFAEENVIAYKNTLILPPISSLTLLM